MNGTSVWPRRLGGAGRPACRPYTSGPAVGTSIWRWWPGRSGPSNVSSSSASARRDTARRPRRGPTTGHVSSVLGLEVDLEWAGDSPLRFPAPLALAVVRLFDLQPLERAPAHVG